MTPESTNNLDLFKNQMGFGSLSSIKSAAKGLSEANKNGAGDAEKKRWKASLDFEAMFLGQMYKAMRQTSETAGSELTEASPGREIFTEMLDNQYASMHSKSPIESGDQGLHNAITGASNSMAAQIYRAMARKEGATLPSPSMAKMVNSQARSGQPSEVKPMTEEKLNPIVEMASKTYDVAASLIKSVIKAESANQPLAVSGAGAKGLMQLMDSTARDLGVRNVFNAQENVFAGTRYLKQLLNRFNGNEEKALAAYNAGPSTVEKFGGVPPYQETKDYVKKVLNHKRGLDASATAGTEGMP
jgi:Rod binding domain-containing protein